MDYSLTILAVIFYVESRLRTDIDYSDLERATGFSLAHLRQVFAGCMGVSLTRYIRERRIANAAFDLIHTEGKLLDIAAQYGFDNPDTFTRAFRRVTALTPSEFRRRKMHVGSKRLYGGTFGVALESDQRKEESMSDSMINGVVLYGVNRVGYGVYGCTPYPICLKACANYLGQAAEYDEIMAGSGAAFRLVWNRKEWDGGNVDVIFTYDDPGKIYREGANALGRELNLLGRTPGTKKEEFIAFIKAEIDAGRPVIALGIIGPPEACLVTGYREDGDTLLGWNFFQDRPEFGETVIDESGYFVSGNWWENSDTVAVMALSETNGTPLTVKRVVDNAVEALSGRECGDYAKGISAYDAWKTALLDDSQFVGGMVLQLLAERLMCQGDAMDCLGDGRDNARRYFLRLAEKNPGEPRYAALANRFREVCDGIGEMGKILGGFERGEEQARALADPGVRGKLAACIDRCKVADEKALALLKEMQAELK